MTHVMRGYSFKYGVNGIPYSFRATMFAEGSPYAQEHGERSVGFRCVRVCRSPSHADRTQA